MMHRFKVLYNKVLEDIKCTDGYLNGQEVSLAADAMALIHDTFLAELNTAVECYYVCFIDPTEASAVEIEQRTWFPAEIAEEVT
jgi:hypothetical protein